MYFCSRKSSLQLLVNSENILSCAMRSSNQYMRLSNTKSKDSLLLDIHNESVFMVLQGKLEAIKLCCTV